MNKINSLYKKMIFEEIILSDGKTIKRLKSSVFYWLSLISFLIGIEFIDRGYGFFFLIITLAPFFLLYPLFRYLFGGRDSIASVIFTFIINEIFKESLKNKLSDKKENK